MEPVKVAVQGALGKMGQEIIKGLSGEPTIKVAGGVDVKAARDTLPLPDGSTVPLSAKLENIITASKPQVLVDFSNREAVLPAVRLASQKGVNLVIGTTGITADEVKEIERLVKDGNVGAVVAPNFALGAVLMMHLARIAAKYMDWAEIIELHHNQKLDAPSGTAMATARGMAAARGKPFSPSADSSKSWTSRGERVEGVPIHSVRLLGLVAHQEVILGGLGQTLSIRHDTIGRECYIPGIIIAIKEVVNRKGLTYGLDSLLNL